MPEANPDQGRLPTDVLGGDQVRARRSDPATSHAAARSVSGLTEKQKAVFYLVAKRGPYDDVRLVEDYNELSSRFPDLFPVQTDSGIRTRRHELAERGLLRESGEVRLKTGRTAKVWATIFDRLPEDRP